LDRISLSLRAWFAWVFGKLRKNISALDMPTKAVLERCRAAKEPKPQQRVTKQMAKSWYVWFHSDYQRVGKIFPLYPKSC
jgi:hypothetical protein